MKLGLYNKIDINNNSPADTDIMWTRNGNRLGTNSNETPTVSRKFKCSDTVIREVRKDLEWIGIADLCNDDRD